MEPAAPRGVTYTRDFLAKMAGIKGWEIGAHSYGTPVVSQWPGSGRLFIGRYCSIAAGAHIYLGGDHRIDWATTYPFGVFDPAAAPIRGHPTTRGDVVIGNDVWLAAGCVILSGVTIGDGAVIGARAVVSRNVPPYGIAAGNPARVLRSRFTPRQVERLLALRWWDHEPDRLRPLYRLIPGGQRADSWG
jgi:acetyltransferase-like isoleucine patch superfamily enzyme